MCCVLMLATIVGISSGVIILIITAVMVGAYGDADVVQVNVTVKVPTSD